MTRASDPGYPLDPALEFMRHVWGLNHALERRSTRMERELGVSAPQRLILRCVGKYPGLTAGQLARLVHLDPGSVSAALRRLEERGLLERRRDPRDRRRVALGLTPEGHRLARPLRTSVETAVDELLAQTSPAELETTSRVLSHLSALLATE